VHRYAAQLIHYGLPVTKDKNGAKVRLLNALNQFKLEVPAWILKLEVPAWILKLEGELKKEWEGENRKMKKSVASAAKGKSVKKSGGGNSKDATQMAPSGSGINVNGELAGGFIARNGAHKHSKCVAWFRLVDSWPDRHHQPGPGLWGKAKA
jgi:hypothetical protein